MDDTRCTAAPIECEPHSRGLNASRIAAMLLMYRIFRLLSKIARSALTSWLVLQAQLAPSDASHARSDFAPVS